MSTPGLGLLYLGSRPASRIVEVARYAERAGIDYFWIPDERFFREVYSLCTLVAGATDRILVGPCVTDPYTRHPALTAMAVTTLDEVSDGRAVLGLGAGVSGFAELGIERRKPARAVGESIKLVRQLLTGAPVTFSGGIFDFAGSLNFTPRRSDVPIYVAAGGPLMLRTAGELANGVIIEACAAPVVLETALTQIVRGVERARRSEAPQIVARLDVAVEDTESRARDLLRHRVSRHLINAAPNFERFRQRGLEVPPRLRELVSGLGYTHDPLLLGRIGAELPDEYIDAFCIAATPGTVGRRLELLLESGATQLIVNPIATDDRVEPVIDSVASWARATR